MWGDMGKTDRTPDLVSYIPAKETNKQVDKILSKSALAGVAQWIEHGPVNQRVASSIPSQGTCLGCWPGPQ